MISSSHSRSSTILHLSRPARLMLMRVSLLLLFLLAIGGVFVSQSNGTVASNIRTYVVDVSMPVLTSLVGPGNMVSKVNDFFHSYFMVHEKNKVLEVENQKLKNQLIRLSGVSYENERLRALLHYVQPKGFKYISANVVGNTSGPFLRSVLINVGEGSNIKKGQAVINENGLVGRIVEVGKYSSRVLLLTDINSNIPVISSRSRERSIMSGNNDEMPQLLYLPKDSKIVSGEVLMTSGDGEMFPAGLQVGTVRVDMDRMFRVVLLTQWHQLEHLSVIEYMQ